jgi:EmrB/QacA subfamily drug resistance transporter
MISAVNIALPAMSAEIPMDSVLLSWVPTAFLLTSSVFLLPFGGAADRVGRKRIYFWGICIFTMASPAIGLATAAWHLIVARVFQGLGCAMVFASGTAIVTSVFPPGERGKVLGLNVAAVYGGLTAGPFLGGYLTQEWGWRSIFYVPVPLGVFILFLITRYLRWEWREEACSGFDWIGTFLYSSAIFCGFFGISLLKSSWGLPLLVFAALLSGSFLTWEGKTREPLLDVQLFRENRVFAFGNLATFIHYSATYANSFLLSIFLQSVQGLTPVRAGGILLAQPIMQALFSPLSGRLSDSCDPRYPASIGMGMTGLGLVFLAGITSQTSSSTLMAVLAFMGVGFALFSSPNINSVMSSVEKRRYGQAAGIQGTVRVLGQLAGMTMVSTFFLLSFGEKAVGEIDPGRLTGVIGRVYLVSALLCLVGIPVSLARGKGDRAQKGSD